MRSIKAIYDLFWNKDDLFQNEAEMFRNIVCTGISRNTKSSFYSSLISHLALSVPTLGLLVILYIGTLSLIRPSILDLLSSFYSCYKVILTLNSSIVSFLSRLTSRSLKLFYFLILSVVLICALKS